MRHRSSGIILFKKIFFMACMCLPCIITRAQSKIEFAKNVQGKITRSNQIYKFIQSFKAITDTKASSLAKTAAKIEDAVYNLPQLNPPMGFNVQSGVATYDVELKNKEPQLKVFFYLRYLEKDAGKIKTSMDGADLYMEVNPFDLFHQVGNYWQDCDKIKFPVFFEALPITDSSADYIQTIIKSRPVRIITTNKPLFIPLTRKEFMQFLIARDHYRIKENQDLINDEKTQIADTKKNISDPVYKSVKSTLEQTIPKMEEQIKKLNKETESLQQKIAHFHQVMDAMAAEEAAAPARMDYNKKSEELFGLEQLVPAGSKEGVLLNRINPGYYNHAANAPAAQLIAVYYSWSTVGFKKDPDYVQQAAVNIFKELNYHALKMSLQ